VLVEIQALVSRSALAMPRRTAIGLDTGRVALLLAVLEKRLGLRLYDQDVFLNVAGGLRIDEPAADLAIVAAVASSVTGRALAADVVVWGEVGLTGEVRSVSRSESRLREAARAGFRRCVVPASDVPGLSSPGGTSVDGVRSVDEALRALAVSAAP
jgi:DNA repair protein RadA/Sms